MSRTILREFEVSPQRTAPHCNQTWALIHAQACTQQTLHGKHDILTLLTNQPRDVMPRDGHVLDYGLDYGVRVVEERRVTCPPHIYSAWI